MLEKRALMLPQELKAMGPDRQIILYEGLAHPVLCRKIRYYKDGYFTKRLMPKMEVERLDLKGDSSMKGKTVGIVAASALALLSACTTAQTQHAEQLSPPQHDGKPLDPADWADWAADLAAEQASAQANAYNAVRPARPRPPGPAAGFPPAPAVPPIPAEKLRTDLLRLLDSIQALDGTNRENVEAIMGVRMGKPERTDTWFEYRGKVSEGWGYAVEVVPRNDQPNSTIDIHLGPERLPDNRHVLAQCSFNVDEFLADIGAAGWTVGDRAVNDGSRRYWRFYRYLPKNNLAVGGRVFFNFLDKESIESKACVTELMVNAGHPKGEE